MNNNNNNIDEDFSVYFTSDDECEHDCSSDSDDSSDDSSDDTSDNSSEDVQKKPSIREIIELKYHEVITCVEDRSDELKVIHESEFKEQLRNIENILSDSLLITKIKEYVKLRKEVFGVINKFRNDRRYFDTSMLYLYFVLYIFNHYSNSQWFTQTVMPHVMGILEERNRDNKNNYRVFMLLSIDNNKKVSVDVDTMNEHYLPCLNSETRNVNHQLHKWRAACNCTSHGCYAIRCARNVAQRFNNLIDESMFVGKPIEEGKTKLRVCPTVLKILNNKAESLKCVAIVQSLLCDFGRKSYVPLYSLRWIMSVLFYMNNNINGIHGKIIYELFYSTLNAKREVIYGNYKNNGSDSFYCSKPHNLIEQMINYVQGVDNVFYLKNYTGPERINHECGKKRKRTSEDENVEESESEENPLTLLSRVACKISKM
jgi:hypothetical protein